MPYKDVVPPPGEKITRTDRLNVPDQPIIPFIRADGTGPDICAVRSRRSHPPVEEAYGGRKTFTLASSTPPARLRRKRFSISCKRNFQNSSTKSGSGQRKKRRLFGRWSAHPRAITCA